MKQLNLRKKFYGSVIRAVLTILVLILLLAIAPQADMLQNQKITLGKTTNATLTGIEIAKVLISLIIVGILLNFAYISETQLPNIAKLNQVGLIIASVVHIVVIFIAYSYLLPFAKDSFGRVNQIFNAVFLLLLCVPLFRGGMGLYKTIDDIAKGVANRIGETISCQKCGAENDPSTKFCSECGNGLVNSAIAQKTFTCQNCGKENETGTKFCADCGAKLPVSSTQPRNIVCPQCDTENSLGAKHCTACGTVLSTDT